MYSAGCDVAYPHSTDSVQRPRVRSVIQSRSLVSYIFELRSASFSS